MNIQTENFTAANHLFGLNYGDRTFKIGVVAPAGKPTFDAEKWQLMQDIMRSVPALKFSYPDGMIDEKVSPYLANTDQLRMQYLIEALRDDSLDLIWCLRGGYGVSRVLKAMAQQLVPAAKKFIVGFSDITALHLFLFECWGWKSIHGPGLLQTAYMKERDNGNFQALFDIINGKQQRAIMHDLKPINEFATASHAIKGIVVGGNLAMCEASIGTAWQMNTKDRIVMLEDVNENGYAIDRTLYHMQEAGMLNNAAAIVFGDFIGGDEHVNFALHRFANEVAVPVFSTKEFGHGYLNRPFIHGALGELYIADDVAQLYQPDSALPSIL